MSLHFKRPLQLPVGRKWSVMAGMAGRDYDGTPVEALCEGQKPRFGFWWWYWVPTIHKNQGRLIRRECIDVSLHWLCFWVCLTGFPK